MSKKNSHIDANKSVLNSKTWIGHILPQNKDRFITVLELMRQLTLSTKRNGALDFSSAGFWPRVWLFILPLWTCGCCHYFIIKKHTHHKHFNCHTCNEGFIYSTNLMLYFCSHLIQYCWFALASDFIINFLRIPLKLFPIPPFFFAAYFLPIKYRRERV